ncbi:hypothetical protein SEA_STICKYNOTE_12 [Corynebacterium phage Stickynote]|uniref:Uncharacterized protein n=1 Tax=Corynebacterium phage Stickynote TaxID=2588503 RepID=A0A4Y6ETJ7_9CAUD|nr:hypothetical protein KNU65_gp12 [Corynebacterium phage Stickynote]QDF19209.1 hypothetical protein SEA_STICKYNOTE_12 [Corynebacterium phage Stickynote]
MARKRGRSKRSLNSNPKGKGKYGSKWGHNFTPKNAVARKLKAKTYGRKSVKTRLRK